MNTTDIGTEGIPMPTKRRGLKSEGKHEGRACDDVNRSPRHRSQIHRYNTRQHQQLDERQRFQQESIENSTSESEDYQSEEFIEQEKSRSAHIRVPQNAHYSPKGTLVYGKDFVPEAKCVPKSDHWFNSVYIIIIPVIILIVLYISFQSSFTSYGETGETATEILENELRDLKDKFPSQVKELWPTFYSGIRKVVEDDPNSPSVFVLLDHGTETTSECLAKEVGKAAVKFLHNGNYDPVIIDGRDLKKNESFLNDHGEFTDTYKPIMQSIGVMIVNNLQEIPGRIAQTFHTFCDEVNPLVDKAVYFFTLKTSRSLNGSPTYMAEATLSSLWKRELEGDIMDALVIRMTGSVTKIEPEKAIPCSE